MELLWSVQHLQCVFTIFLLHLQCTEGDSESEFPSLGCYNQSSTPSLQVSPPDQVTEPASFSRLCLQQRCCSSGCVPNGDVLGVGPYVCDVAEDDSIDSLQVGKLHPQISACLAPSSLQNTAVQIYTDKQAYAAGTDVTFLAMTKEADPLEFHWQFGDSVTVTTRSRSLIKRFVLPERYNVTVRVSSALHSVSSEVYPVVIQTAVQLNRLLFMPSVLLDTPVQFSCRTDAGTNVSYLWNFEDGTQRVGHSTEQHVFNRPGEFTVEVTVFNLISSASLKGHLFVVSEACQPPPVKNMGPSTIQVWRYQPVSLGVTFESQIQCNISSGLLYTWFLYTPTGQQLHIPFIQTNRQNLELPEYLLHYGTYKAVAKVEVVGTIVYSNYSVQIEVRSSLPVSVISGGTNLFINHNNNNMITLDGRKSYDPDYPDYVMSYSWRCRSVNSAGSSCFRENIPDSLAVLTFPARALQPDCDLFKLTLTVHSANRSSSSHIFLTVRSKPTRTVHILCRECRGNSVNWNELFSVTAACENCPETVSYSWKLYSVNASSKTVPEGPLAQKWNEMSSSSDDLPDMINIRHKTLSRVSELPSTSPFPSLLLNSLPLPEVKEPYMNQILSERTVEKQEGPLASIDLLSGLESVSAAESSGASSEDDFSPYLYAIDPEDESSNKSNITSEYSSIHEELDYEYFHSGLEEAEAGEPVGRPAGPYGLEDMVPHSDEREGDNLVDPSNVGRVAASEKSLLDLEKELIQPALFQSYTSTGTSSSSITFKPSVLKPKTLYMLEVFTSFDWAPLGKAQLFFNTHSAPEGTACHVQPSTGQEINTHFSIFCTSGKQDLLYKYSFSVGNSTKKLLYEGRDFQHYFNLPAGDPHNNHEVTIYIEIRNRFGSATRPCPVAVTVQPSFQRPFSSNPDQELFVYGLGNLTSLMQMRNSRDIINYVYLLTVVLNRLSLDSESSKTLQTHTRAALISAVCQLTVTTKGLLLDISHTLTDLLNISNQVTFESAELVTKYIRHVSFLHEANLPVSHILDLNVVKAVVFVLSNVLEVPVPSSRPGIQLTQNVLHLITDTVLMFMHSSKGPQCSVNTTTLNLIAWQHSSSPPAVKTVHKTTFYIPNVLDTHIKQGTDTHEQSLCFITQLIAYKQNPYHWTRTPVQLNGDVADMKLFNCTNRREIKRRYLSTPVIVEFQKHEEMNQNSGDMKFTLARSKVNNHLFNITPELLQKTLLLRVEFSRPTQRAFPIMLLFRMHKKPTLTWYNMKKVYHWKEQMVQIYLPPSSLKDAGTAYLMLLDADYNKSPINKYTANAVNYTLSIQFIQCLAWDGLREWKPDGCSVLNSFTSTKINCSCSHLTSFSVTHQTIHSNYSVTNITEYTSTHSSLTSCILIAVSVVMYAVLLAFCKRADVRTEKSSGSFLLPDNDPLDQFLYTVTIHTGLRSTGTMTAKVYIILYGEYGASQTRELSSSDHQLFTSNSTNTFILRCIFFSTPSSLGRVRQVHLWHDSSGPSPSWYLSHVLVKDLLHGCSWIFQAQCWLSVAEGDGRVERRLQALERKLTFREYTSELGLIGVSLGSVVTGLCALTLLPVGSLVSYLFRISKPNKSRSNSGDQYKVRLPHVYTVEDHHDNLLLRDRHSEPNLSWTHNREKSEQGIQDWKDTYDFVSVTRNKLANDSKLQRTTDSSSCIEIFEENIPENIKKLQDQHFKHSLLNLQSSPNTVKASSKNHEPYGSKNNTLQVWCYYTAWAVWLCLCLAFMIITAILGLKFNSTKCLLWIQSVVFSLLFCAFAVHPAMILICSIYATLRCGEQSYFYQSSTFKEPVTELLKQNKQSKVGFKKHFASCSHHQPEEFSMQYKKVLASRQRERYLRLARPPTSAQLKLVRRRIRKRTLIQKTIRELVLYIITLSTAGFVAYGKFSQDTFDLNQAVRTSFTRYLHRPLTSIQTPDTWWDWVENGLLDVFYQQSMSCDGMENNVKTSRGTFSRIGDPVIKKIEHTNSSSEFFQVRFSGLFSRPHLCGKLGCYEGAGIHANLGNNRSEMSSTLQKLRAATWMNSNTKAMIVQFTLYSPAYSLFTTVTMLEEPPPTGSFQPAIFVHSTQLYYSATALDYWLTAAELFFLLLSLLQLHMQICAMAQRAWSYWTNLWNWVEVTSLLFSFLSFICTVHHFTLRADAIEHLQREDFKKFVDISAVSYWEQFSRSLHGILVFLLLMKCCFVLRVNEVMSPAVSTMMLIFSNLLWPLMAGVILIIAFSCLGNLLFQSSLSVFRTLPGSVYWIICHCFSWGRLRYLCGIEHNSHTSSVLYIYEALLNTVSIALRAMVIGAVTSYAKKAKRRKHHLSVSDLLTYTRDMTLLFIGKGRRNWLDSHDNTNEEKMIMIPMELDLDPSCTCSVSSYIHEEHGEHSLRSQLDWKTLQPLGRSRGMNYDGPMSSDPKIYRNMTVPLGTKPKDSQTLLCVSVQIECSDTLSSNKDQHVNLASGDNMLHKAWSTRTVPATVLNSPPDNMTGHSAHTEACRQFCMYDSTQTYSEDQTVNIPGQCC
ncbi:hypothetical protein NFI96_029574 [Prochilodus magdalenae]|nr:hypothetical protein NFI96_029574 [Prochilodus magdalenae]